LSEESRDLTTFTAPDGRRYRYRRCPFGLNNSPSQLNLILGNLFNDKSRFHSLACYADDLTIYSCNWKSHLQQLELTLRTLQAVRLSCNPRKTEIGASEIEYLGYMVSGDSVRMSKKRIQVINDISAPKNLKALQRLLGMFQYWKKLIPYFSKNTHHMRSLLKKDAAFSWTAQCQSELDYLKSCLVSDPILKPFDSNREIIIHIDGSSHGLGFAVLQCGDDNNLHAVKYGSYATTPHQAKYTADDLEAVALIYALRSIESVALLKHGTIITDNSHVLHIKDWTPVNNWQRRMLTHILQFNLTILFIKGSRNLLADALPRMYQDSTVQERADHQATFMHETDDVVLPVTAIETCSVRCRYRTRPMGRTGPLAQTAEALMAQPNTRPFYCPSRRATAIKRADRRRRTDECRRRRD